MIDLGASLFSPSRESGIALRRTLNSDFAQSFEHIFEACGEHFDFDERQAEALVSRIRAGSRETPYMFSLHFKLFEAIEDDRLDDVQALIARILSIGPAEPGVLLTSFVAEEFPWDGEIIADYFATEESSDYRYGAPAADAVPSRRAELQVGLDLIYRGAPDLAAELEELVTTIILARRVPIETTSRLLPPFEGASALRSFGAILLDVESDQTDMHCAITFIHEEAHQALFAFSPMESVVTNEYDERYPHPLRDDPRPLEGIFHATFVLARIVYGMEAMLSSGRLSSAEKSLAATISKTNQPLFFEALETVRRHGKLTPQGEAALEVTESYMAPFS